MKLKSSWLTALLPLVLNIVADIISDSQMQSECRRMVKEEVAKAIHGK